jgi:hypothetical protein
MHPKKPFKQYLQCTQAIQITNAMNPKLFKQHLQYTQIIQTTHARNRNIQRHGTPTSMCTKVPCYTYYTRYICQDSSLGVIKTTYWLPKCFPTYVTCIQLCNLGGCLLRSSSEWHS